MTKKYSMKIMGDYNNEIEFDHISDLYNPQTAIEEVKPLKYAKFLDTINQSVLILKKFGDDFLIVKPEGPQLKYSHDSKELCGRIYSKVYPVYHELGFSDILKEVDETNEIISVKSTLRCSGDLDCSYEHTFFKDHNYFFVTANETTTKDLEKEHEDAIFDNSLRGVFNTDKEGKIVRMNSAFKKICGFSQDELNEKGLDNVVVGYEPSQSNPEITSFSILKEKLINREIREAYGNIKIIDKDNNLRWLKGHTETFANNRIARTKVYEFTKEKIASENALRLQKSLEEIGLNNHIALISSSPDKRYFTRDVYKILEIEEGTDFIEDYEKFIVEEDIPILRDAINSLTTTNRSAECSFRLKTSKGDIKYIDCRLKDIYGGDSEGIITDIFGCHGVKGPGFKYTLGFIQDNTELLQKELELEALTKKLVIKNCEKELLLKEVHHRVRNNLQLILSFVNLERRFHEDNLEMTIDTMRLRIKTMSIIHEKIYSSPDLQNINLDEFLKELAQTQLIFHEIDDVDVKVDLDPSLKGNMATLTSISLICTELFLNTVLYAFEENQTDKTIEYYCKEEGDKICLIYKDNGKGLPEGIGLENPKTLGFNIIKLLSEQLDGSIEDMATEKGAAFKLSLPAKRLR